MKPTYYITTCLCKLSKEKLKRKGGNRVCSIHGGEIIHRKRECLDCNNELILCGTGDGKLRCPEHQKLHIKRMQRIANDKIYAPIKKKNAIKKAENESARKKKIELEKVAAEAKKRKLLVKKKPIHRRLIGWSSDPRGDYCCWLKTCQRKGALSCSDCIGFSGIYFGYDPGRKVA